MAGSGDSRVRPLKLLRSGGLATGCPPLFQGCTLLVLLLEVDLPIHVPPCLRAYFTVN